MRKTQVSIAVGTLPRVVPVADPWPSRTPAQVYADIATDIERMQAAEGPTALDRELIRLSLDYDARNP